MTTLRQVTPGCKERISANAGRIYAALVRCSPFTVAQDTVGTAEAAVQGAIQIENALLAAIRGTDD